MLSIVLTSKEKELFNLLLKINEELKLDLVLRIAGGWVRDKIMGKTSDDIDITIDKMTGVSFASKIKEYFEKNELEEIKIGHIEANPEQSKHLETATIKIMDIVIDLVNLRTEDYTDNSRIPNIKIGTPYDDARRRDLTINSLYYNINRGVIEDFTKKGLEDINDRFIRTPLDPIITFLEDPLRILRAIRFCVRFNFKMDPKIIKAAHDPYIIKSFKTKVTKERILTEVIKILNGNNVDLAMDLFIETKLWELIFEIPDEYNKNQSIFVPIKKRQHAIYNYLELEKNYNLNKSISTYLSIILYPLHSIKYRKKGKKNDPANLMEYVLKNSLKISNKLYDSTIKIASNVDIFSDIVNKIDNRLNIVDIGMIIRSFSDKLIEIMNTSLSLDITRTPDNKDMIIEKYINFHIFLKNNSLEDVWKLEPLINGRDIIKLFGLKPGPNIGKIQETDIKWQIKYPRGTRDQLIEFIINKIRINKDNFITLINEIL